MGIRGLTTFIEKKSNLFYENYELHDTNLVIDGNSLACQLYSLHCKSNDCFGGDYDKFAETIRTFFQLLKDSNVVPYLIFDGGYEKRKLKTIMERMRNKIQSAEQLSSVTEGSISVYPLFLKETFNNLIEELKINKVRCDFEGDSEVACLAKALNCPILSYDSDFYIFDALYIPFNTVGMALNKSKDKSYNYVYCQVYKIEKFLDYYGGMPKTNLPILAVLLGNDYVKSSTFEQFYNHIKIQKCKTLVNEQQRRIKSVIVWLQNETIKSATEKILSRFKLKRRNIIADKIQEAIKGYHVVNSTFVKYLNIKIDHKVEEDIQLDINIDEIPEEIGAMSPDLNDADVGDYDPEIKDNIPQEFLEKYRTCQLPPSFMDIYIQHKYYCIPQIEDHTLEPSHKTSFNILAAIYKILCSDAKDNLVCIARCGKLQVKHYTIPEFEMQVPTFKEIQFLDENTRKHLLLKILGIDPSFIEKCLMEFPNSWPILLITLKYMSMNKKFRIYYIYGIILCAIILNYVDKQIGFYRSTKSFDNKFHKTLKTFKPHICENSNKLTEVLSNISKKDSILCMNDLIHLFQMSLKLKTNYRLFNKHIIHDLAEFQSCLLHIIYLNALLNYPFQNLSISHFYDGTFLYNISTSLKRRTDLDAYVKILLQNAPEISTSFAMAADILKEQVVGEKTNPDARRRKKRRKTIEESNETVQEEEQPQEAPVHDPNNKFSVLLSLDKF